jgi:hypothetical protein
MAAENRVPQREKQAREEGYPINMLLLFLLPPPNPLSPLHTSGRLK